MTGLTARQRMVGRAARSRRTSRRRRPRGGYTERRIAGRSAEPWSWRSSCARRLGRSAPAPVRYAARAVRRAALRDDRRRRTADARSATAGCNGRTANGDPFDMLRDSQQPLLMLAEVEGPARAGRRRPRAAAEAATANLAPPAADPHGTRGRRKGGTDRLIGNLTVTAGVAALRRHRGHDRRHRPAAAVYYALSFLALTVRPFPIAPPPRRD